MKRAKLLRLIEQVRAETFLEDSAPVTFDILSIDFEARTVSFKGRTIKVEHRGFDAPLLTTDRLIVTRNGSEVV